MAGVELLKPKKAVARERLTKVENVTDGRDCWLFLSELAEYYGLARVHLTS